MFAVKDLGNGTFKRAKEPFFTDVDVYEVEYTTGDHSIFRFYFTEAYLSTFEPEVVIAEYEKTFGPEGLRIYMGAEWNMFELL